MSLGEAVQRVKSRATPREIAVRLVQAVILYLVGGIILFAPVFLDSLDDYDTVPVSWWVEMLVSWPTEVTRTGVVAIIALVLVLFGLTKAASWVVAQFRTTLSGVPSRRAFLGFMLLSATVGAGVGVAAEPLTPTEHSHCQDLPDSAFVSFEGVYEKPNGDLVYFAGGTNVWMFDGDDWFVTTKRSGYGRTGYAYEASYQRNGEYYYAIANDTSLTIYEKNRTEIGAHLLNDKRQFDFVSRCTGETDV